MLHAIIYEADEYLLLYSEPGHVFHPKQFGITTDKLSSGCLRGFDCTFEIKDGGLFLASLEVRAKDGLYPLINDTPPAFPRACHALRGRIELSIRVMKASQ